MQARMDTQQVHLDSLEDLLDIMAVGNPLLQKASNERRQTLGKRQAPPNPRIENLRERASLTSTSTA
ncbi:hypothetical protein Bca101_010416 [Brassica carinata]